MDINVIILNKTLEKHLAICKNSRVIHHKCDLSKEYKIGILKIQSRFQFQQILNKEFIQSVIYPKNAR